MFFLWLSNPKLIFNSLFLSNLSAWQAVDQLRDDQSQDRCFEHHPALNVQCSNLWATNTFGFHHVFDRNRTGDPCWITDFKSVASTIPPCPCNWTVGFEPTNSWRLFLVSVIPSSQVVYKFIILLSNDLHIGAIQKHATRPAWCYIFNKVILTFNYASNWIIHCGTDRIRTYILGASNRRIDQLCYCSFSTLIDLPYLVFLALVIENFILNY